MTTYCYVVTIHTLIVIPGLIRYPLISMASPRRGIAGQARNDGRGCE
jgi:hypothetical protein